MPRRSDEISDQQKIQDFIRPRFNEGELREFCLKYFPSVHDEFTDGMTRSRMVGILVGYCRRHEQIPDLIAALKQERPEQFHQR